LNNERVRWSAAVVLLSLTAWDCWPGADPLGKRLTMDDPKRQAWMTVVGVVGEVRQESLAADPLLR
jgi:hypothetical protein